MLNSTSSMVYETTWSLNNSIYRPRTELAEVGRKAISLLLRQCGLYCDAIRRNFIFQKILFRTNPSRKAGKDRYQSGSPEGKQEADQDNEDEGGVEKKDVEKDEEEKDEEKKDEEEKDEEEKDKEKKDEEKKDEEKKNEEKEDEEKKDEEKKDEEKKDAEKDEEKNSKEKKNDEKDAPDQVI